ncbi:mitochondrial cardiolipin hydrolase-like [Bradysia coprophila]|uniref:mitochondrial cardiolipin hydrolase-like n=1 Tax=Bradysia coprophila TaxID=38358 RepID=UPI00187DAB06|nr:mitochondrial cardiolipin hydrolase-like [Bradysia coprophila]
MPNYFLYLNTLIAVTLTPLVCIKLYRLIRKPKPLKQVLFANNISGCCSDTNFSTVNTCPNQYCFKNNLWQIVRLIDQSQNSICLALYTLSLDDVKNALTRAKCRGVQIRIITTEESMKNLSRDFTRLSTSGIAIRFPLHGTERLLHHKLCIIDGEDRKYRQSKQSVPVLLSGSMNWTMSSFTSNWDNITIDSDYDVVKKSQREFDSMWDSFKRSN